jgi:hypothetical protein
MLKRKPLSGYAKRSAGRLKGSCSSSGGIPRLSANEIRQQRNSKAVRILKERYGARSRPFRIEPMRVQVVRQRKEILQLQRAGISTASAELLLGRMDAKIDDLCA